MLSERVRGLKDGVFGEATRFSGVFLYVWVILALFALHKKVVLPQADLVEDQVFAFVNAFILAKVMFVAERFRLAENLQGRPFIYPILYKSLIFSLLLVCFSLVEEIAVGFLKGRPIGESLARVAGGSLVAICLIAVILFFVLMPLFALREFAREMGKDKVFELFFGRRQKRKSVGS